MFKSRFALLLNPCEDAQKVVDCFQGALDKFQEVGEAVRAHLDDEKFDGDKAKRKVRCTVQKFCETLEGNGVPRVIAFAHATKVKKDGRDVLALSTSESLKMPCIFTAQQVQDLHLLKGIVGITSNKENRAKLVKKADNLKAKMKAKAAISSVALECADMSFATAEPDVLLPLQVSEAAAETFRRPFLVASEEASWTWDVNAWPLPAVPSILVGLEGKVALLAVEYAQLKKAGATAVSALDNWLLSRGESKTFLLDMPIFSMVVDVGTVVWLPGGWIPLAITLGDADGDKTAAKKAEKAKSVMITIPVLHDGGLSKLQKEAAFDIKQNLDGILANLGNTNTWSVAAPAAVKWATAELPAVAAAAAEGTA